MKVKISQYHPEKHSRKTKVKFNQDDIMDLRETLAIIIHPALIRFKEDSSSSYPVFIPNMTLERWTHILDDMIEGFALMLNFDLCDENRKKVDKALQLFSQYYIHLWY